MTGSGAAAVTPGYRPSVPDPLLFVLDAQGEPHPADPRAPLVPADDLALLRGEGVFETMRVAAPRAHGAPAHLTRLAGSALAVDVELPPRGALEQLVAAAAAAWPEGEEASLRLVVTKGSVGSSGIAYALVSPIPATTVAARRGVRAVTLTLGVPAGLRATAPWLLPGVKSTSYAVAMAALRAAAAAGAEDVVWVSTDGEVLEASTANVAWVGADGVLVSPPAAEVGVLAGTTLAEVLVLAAGRGVGCDSRRGTLAELVTAREAFLVSSVRGVAPLLALDDTAIGDGTPGQLTVALQADLDAAVRAPLIPLDGAPEPS